MPPRTYGAWNSCTLVVRIRGGLHSTRAPTYNRHLQNSTTPGRRQRWGHVSHGEGVGPRRPRVPSIHTRHEVRRRQWGHMLHGEGDGARRPQVLSVPTRHEVWPSQWRWGHPLRGEEVGRRCPRVEGRRNPLPLGLPRTPPHPTLGLPRTQRWLPRTPPPLPLPRTPETAPARKCYPLDVAFDVNICQTGIRNQQTAQPFSKATEGDTGSKQT
jgi:hypothetical protein